MLLGHNFVVLLFSLSQSWVMFSLKLFLDNEIQVSPDSSISFVLLNEISMSCPGSGLEICLVLFTLV